MNNVMRRVIALREARDRAQDPDFKLLWDQKGLHLGHQNNHAKF